MLVGGAIFGALGYLFAPQISKALLSDDQRLKLPRFLEEEKKSPEATKQVLLGNSGSIAGHVDCCHRSNRAICSDCTCNECNDCKWPLPNCSMVVARRMTWHTSMPDSCARRLCSLGMRSLLYCAGLGGED